MDPDFDHTYQRLSNAFRGFINGWFAETEQRWGVDKNCGWLQHLELVNHLDPNFKMVVCIRKLGVDLWFDRSTTPESNGK